MIDRLTTQAASGSPAAGTGTDKLVELMHNCVGANLGVVGTVRAPACACFTLAGRLRSRCHSEPAPER